MLKVFKLRKIESSKVALTALKIRKLFAALQIELSHIKIPETVYPLKSILVCREIELLEIVVRYPNSCDILVLAQVKLCELVERSINATKLHEVLNALERLDTHTVTVNVPCNEQLVRIKDTVPVLVKCLLNILSENRIRKSLLRDSYRLDARRQRTVSLCRK